MKKIKGNIYNYIPRRGVVYFYHPTMEIAFRAVFDSNNDEFVFVKNHGKREIPCDRTSKYYTDCYFFAVLMSKEEYDSF